MKNPKNDIAVLSLKASAASDVGMRKNNEDVFLIDIAGGLFIVADGMGGHEKGEVASWFAADNLRKILSALKTGRRGDTMDHDFSDPSLNDKEALLQYAVWSVNCRLFEENERLLSSEADKNIGRAEAEFLALTSRRKRMGTTLVSLLVVGNDAFITHVGDSRAYRIKKDTAELFTRDHTWVEDRLREGSLTEEEGKVHAKRNVLTRSVGFRKDVEVDTEVLALNPPERFLLCSDGLSNVVGRDDILLFGNMPDMSNACRGLVELAKANGGRDNITAVLVDVSRQDGHSDRGQFDRTID